MAVELGEILRAGQVGWREGRLDRLAHLCLRHPDSCRGHPAIVVSKLQHLAIPVLRGTVSATARDVLARDIRNLRRFTNAPNDALKKVIDLNRRMYPGHF